MHRGVLDNFHVLGRLAMHQLIMYSYHSNHKSRPDMNADVALFHETLIQINGISREACILHVCTRNRFKLLRQTRSFVSS